MAPITRLPLTSRALLQRLLRRPTATRLPPAWRKRPAGASSQDAPLHRRPSALLHIFQRLYSVRLLLPAAVPTCPTRPVSPLLCTHCPAAPRRAWGWLDGNNSSSAFSPHLRRGQRPLHLCAHRTTGRAEGEAAAGVAHRQARGRGAIGLGVLDRTPDFTARASGLRRSAVFALALGSTVLVFCAGSAPRLPADGAAARLPPPRVAEGPLAAERPASVAEIKLICAGKFLENDVVLGSEWAGAWLRSCCCCWYPQPQLVPLMTKALLWCRNKCGCWCRAQACGMCLESRVPTQS